MSNWQHCFVFFVCFLIRFVHSNCAHNLPTDGESAVYIEFFRNAQGGTQGDPCPSACDDVIASDWFPINTDTCTTWPGRSGENVNFIHKQSIVIPISHTSLFFSLSLI